VKPKQQHTVDPSKDHHFINGQLVPVTGRQPRDTAGGTAKPKRKTASKPKGVEGSKSPG
jgi:hypothetical protein